MDQQPSVERSALGGNDIEQARAMYENSYNGDTFQVAETDASFSYRYTAAGTPDMTLRSASFLGAIAGSIQPENEYIVQWVLEGGGAYDLGAEETAFTPGRPAMFPTGKRFAFEAHDYRQSLIHFRAGYLEQVAAEHEGALLAPIHFHHAHSPTAQALSSWKTAVDEAAAVVLTGTPTALQLAEVNRRTAIALLSTFPHRVTPLPAGLLTPSAARVRQAVDFIHAHAARALTLTEIAEHAGLSVRSLQLSFHTHLGVTPSGYIRDVRLERVRAELMHLSPADVTVGEVAARWGFAHAGRFSAAYSQKFEEFPSTTLNR